MGFTGTEHHLDPNRNPNDDHDTNLNSDHYTEPNSTRKHHTPFVLFDEPGNQIGAAGATALAPALNEMKGLKELWLHRTCVIGWGSYGLQWHADTTPASCWPCVHGPTPP